MVMTGAQVMDVVAGEGGLRDTLRARRDHHRLRHHSAGRDARGEIRLIRVRAHLIDSPVSGGQFGAEAGTLTMMVAAERGCLRRPIKMF